MARTASAGSSSAPSDGSARSATKPQHRIKSQIESQIERRRRKARVRSRGGAAKPYELELEEVGTALRLHAGLHARILVPHHRVPVVAHGAGGGGGG